jgi:hypothetical protein
MLRQSRPQRHPCGGLAALIADNNSGGYYDRHNGALNPR